MKKLSGKQIITLLSTIVMITVNALANTLPINGLMTGDISDRFDILFVPAGYVFSIWGLIYLGIIIYTIFQLLPAQKDNSLLNKIAPAFWVSSLANTAWILLWHYQIFSLTLPVMLIILGSLLYIFTQHIDKEYKLSQNEKLLVKIPFSIYLGWISVATIANVSQVLFYYSWNGFGIADHVWAIIMLSVATIIGLTMQIRENNGFYVAVLVWAFIGIGIAQAETTVVANTAYLTAGILAAAVIVVTLIRKLRSK